MVLSKAKDKNNLQRMLYAIGEASVDELRACVKLENNSKVTLS